MYMPMMICKNIRYFFLHVPINWNSLCTCSCCFCLVSMKMRSREACVQECSIHICTYAHAYMYRLQLKYGKKYTDIFFALYSWCLCVSIINYYKLLLFHNTSGITGLFCKHCTLPRLRDGYNKKLTTAFSCTLFCWSVCRKCWKWNFWDPKFKNFLGRIPPPRPP